MDILREMEKSAPMLENLKTAKKVVGIKQIRRALQQDTATCVFLAYDADPALTESVFLHCRDAGVECRWVKTMRELGSACGISVGAAAAAIVK